MKTLSHIPQQPDIPDEFIGCHDPTGEDSSKYRMRTNAGCFIFKDATRSDLDLGLSGWHGRKDELVNNAIKYGYTVLSFDSQAELDAWLKEGK